MVDEGGRRGFAIRTCDTNHFGIRVSSCKLNFTNDMDSLFLNFHNHRSCIRNAWTLDNLISIENFRLCVLAFLPLDMAVVKHFLILVCYL